MKPMRIVLLCLLAALAVAEISGCGDKTGKDDEYSIFYLNKESTRIVSKECELKAEPDNSKEVIDELLSKLAADSGDVEYKKPIFEKVAVQKYTLEEKILTLYFNDAYHDMDKVDEALARAAIVRTMMQADGVDFLSFYVGEDPLLDKSGNAVGVMTNDSFIENPGEQINSIETAALKLYFANEKGSGLVSETKEVHYSSNISMEKLVMEHLLEGPKKSNLQSAVPEGTKILNVSVLEGVCYVSLDESFLNQNYNIEEPVVIYSIVNSLSELANINKVQISVKGDTSGVYRDELPFDRLYERNLDYVEE